MGCGKSYGPVAVIATGPYSAFALSVGLCVNHRHDGHVDNIAHVGAGLDDVDRLFGLLDERYQLN